MNNNTHTTNDVKLTIAISNKQPIELLDLTKSLVSVAVQFQKYVKNNGKSREEINAKLYVKEIKTGSVLIDLVEFATVGLIPFAENVNTILDFANYLKKGFEYFLNNEDSEPAINIEDFKDFSSIIEPIAKDRSSQYNISTTVNGDVHVHVTLDSIKANAIQNKIKQEQKKLKIPISNEDGLYTRQSLTFYQARNDTKSKQGNKGIIEAISDKHYNISFSSDDIANEILHGETNPFETAYIVDVTIENINGKPAIYKIHKFHEYFDLNE